MKAANSKLLGIDFCYWISLTGTLIYTYAICFDPKLIYFLSHHKYSFCLDFFPAFFLFINGFAVSLSLRNHKVSSRKIMSFLRKRGFIIGLIGLLFVGIWPMNLLFFCGIIYLFGSLVAQWNNNTLFIVIMVLLAASMALLYAGSTHHITYKNFSFDKGVYSIIGFVFFNGYFSFLPWIVFFLAGLLFGREDVRPRGFFPPSSIFAMVLMFIAWPLNRYASLYDSDFNIYARIEPFFLNSKLNIGAFVFLAVGLAVVLMNIINYVFRRGTIKWLDNFIQDIVSVKYSVIFLHTLIGAIVLRITNSVMFADFGVKLIFVIAIIPLIYTLLYYWKLKVNKVGPIELLIKKFSDSNNK